MTARATNPVEEAEAILRRGAGTNSEHLVRLIHDVNPTSKNLRESEQRRRYAIKAKLQSLLIARFADELTVLPSDAVGVVSLQHRHMGFDACHALIDELDDAARSWVRFQLDTRTIGDAPRTKQPKSKIVDRELPKALVAGGDDTSALIRLGSDAAAAYDFEQAVSYFERAVTLTRGATETVRPLLELWVDRMGADVEALALEVDLPKVALADSEVREFLAIAAARSKDLRHVERLIRGLESPRLGEILALSALAACEQSDAKVAAIWVAHLRSCDPMHPTLAECERLLQDRRDAARASSEQEFRQLVAAGAVDEAERFARELVVRWPDSELAVGWLQERRRVRAVLAAERASAEAEIELGRGALREAAATLASALSVELPQERKLFMKQRIAEIETNLREQAEAQRQREVVSLLGKANQKERAPLEIALEQYLELNPELRARTRQELNYPELDWVEPILLRHGARRAKAASIAVLALALERSALEHAPADALSRLAPHLDLLDDIPEPHKLLSSARRTARQMRMRHALDQLREGEQALGRRDSDDALRILEGIASDDLEPEQREQRLESIRRARAMSHRRDLELRVEQLPCAGNLFAGRDAAVELAMLCAGAERDVWLERRDALQREIAAAYCFECGVTDPGDFWFSAFESNRTDPTVAPVVTPDGNALVVAITAGRWLLVIRLHLETMQPERWARFILPSASRSVDVLRVTATDIALVTPDGACLTLDLATLELQNHFEPKLSNDWQSSGCYMSRDAHWLWRLVETTRRPREERKIQILELPTQRVVREIGGVTVMFGVSGTHDAEVGVVRDQVTSMYPARGGSISGCSLNQWLSAAVSAPTGDGLVGCYCDEERDSQLVLVGPMRRDTDWSESVVADSAGERIHQLAVALEHGIVALRYLVEGGTSCLEAFVDQQGRLSSLYRVELSRTAMLATDRDGRRLWAIDSCSGGLVACAITRESTELPFDAAVAPNRRHIAVKFWDCHRQEDSDPELPAEGIIRQPAIHVASAAAVWRSVAEARLGITCTLSDLRVEARRLSEQPGRFADSDLIELVTEWAFPSDPQTVLEQANRRAHLGDWAGAYRTARELDIDALIEGSKQHAYHLLAACAVQARDFEAALSFRRSGAQQKEGRCDWSEIDHLIADDPACEYERAVKRRSERPTDDFNHWFDDDTGVLALRIALRDATASLAAGHPQAAFAVANVPELIFWNDESLLACATAALLEIEPTSDAERLRREFVTSAFLALEHDQYARRHRTSCRESWDAGRIASIRARASLQFLKDTGANHRAAHPASVETAVLSAAAPEDRLPELAHERLLRLRPGLANGLAELLVSLSEDSPNFTEKGLSETELLAEPRVWRVVELERERLVREEVPALAVVRRIRDLGPHLGYLINHGLSDRVVYWADGVPNESLAVPETEVMFRRLREHGSCHCFALTHPDVLALGVRLLERDREGFDSDGHISSVTAYTWLTDSELESAPLTLAVRLLFVPVADTIPHRVARELEFASGADFNAFLNSHCSDGLEAALDPLVAAPELEALLRIVLRLLFALGTPAMVPRDLGARVRPVPQRANPRLASGAKGWEDRFVWI